MLPILRQVADKSGEAAIMGNIGGAYLHLNQYDRALSYFQQALSIQKQVRDKSGEATTLDNIGSAYVYLSQYDKALTFFQQAMAIQKETGDTVGAALTLGAIQKVQSRQGQNGNADVPASSP